MTVLTQPTIATDLAPLLDTTRRFLAGSLGHLIEGREVQSQSGETLDVKDPATGQTIAQVAAAGIEEVDLAVAAARRAFDDGRWRNLSPSDREIRLHRLAALMEENTDTLAQLEVLDNGMPFEQARAYVAGSVSILRYHAGWPSKIEGRVNPMIEGLHSYTTREPIGVCVGITPWNAPLTVAICKIAPALACGNTSVLKPAEQTPLSAIFLGRLIQEAGIPDGVVNIVNGDGATAGSALVRHPDVDKVAFTGSTDVGRLIQAAAAPTLKRLSMELGGKSPNIVFADADLTAAAAGAMTAAFHNSGQVCFAGTRLLVHRSIHDEFVETLVSEAQGIRLGPGLAEGTQMGPLISQEQFDRVTGYIEIGREEGAELALGGSVSGSAGYFVPPTIFANVTNNLRIAREEIFGPVLSVVPFDDDDEAIRVANDTEYGLGAAVWTRDVSKAHRSVQQIRSGVVWVNTHHEIPETVPFGGFKQSGYGKENGSSSIDTYTQQKSVVIRL